MPSGDRYRDGEEKPKVLKSIRITETHERDLKMEAFRARTSEAEIIRIALTQYFARRRQARLTGGS